MKIQFGHGGHLLEGWLNLEQHEADITKPLAFKDNSVDFILAEHVVEHVTPQEGYRFLLEAYRILKPEGVIRVIVPDIGGKLWEIGGSSEYMGMLREGLKTWLPAIGRPSPPEGFEPETRDAIEALIFCHGHQAVYTEELISVFLQNVGFEIESCEYGHSKHPELTRVDSHWKYMGLENCILESCVVEGTKP